MKQLELEIGNTSEDQESGRMTNENDFLATMPPQEHLQNPIPENEQGLFIGGNHQRNQHN